MGGGDDAHIDLDGRLAADAVELALGQHAQQPRLQCRRHVADFVEEQRAAVGLLEAAAAQRVGAGERALLVAEQLRLQKIRGERRGIERDEGLAGARTVAMQGARHEFLAGARFAGDQHRHAGAGQPADRAKHLLHGGRLAEKLGDAAPGGLDVDGDRRLLRGAAHEVHRLVDVEGLGQVLERAALIGGDRRIQIGVRGHDDDRQAGPRHLNVLEQVEAAAPGHADVGHQHIGRVGAQGRQAHCRPGRSTWRPCRCPSAPSRAPSGWRHRHRPTRPAAASRSCGVHGQRNDEYGSARSAVEFDQAAVAADQILRDAEAQARCRRRARTPADRKSCREFPASTPGPLSSN